MSQPEPAPGQEPDQDWLIEARDLSKAYGPARAGARLAVDQVSLSIRRGEVVGLVGESGSGKSTLGRMLIGLETPTSGTIRIDGRDPASLSARERHHLRRRLQIVFQNPTGALSPRRTIGQTLMEPLVVQGIGPRHDRPAKVAAVLAQVGLSPDHARRYPHELSGGQRQRVALARALILEPDFIIADEPVSALDVSIQAQALNLFRDLLAKAKVAMLFISHDLAVINYLADRVMVMHHGRVVESGSRLSVIFSPRHPYTQQLLASHAATSAEGAPDPSIGTGVPKASIDPVSPTRAQQGNPPGAAVGCHFRSQCASALPVCADRTPHLTLDATGRAVACHLYG